MGSDLRFGVPMELLTTFIANNHLHQRILNLRVRELDLGVLDAHVST